MSFQGDGRHVAAELLLDQFLGPGRGVVDIAAVVEGDNGVQPTVQDDQRALQVGGRGDGVGIGGVEPTHLTGALEGAVVVGVTQ